MHWTGLLALLVVPTLSNGKSRHSRSDSATAVPLTRPPEGLRVNWKQERSLDLSWTEPNPPGTVQGYYVYFYSSYGNQTNKLVEPQAKIGLSELEPGTTYRIWVAGYQLKNKSEILGPPSEVIEVTTKELALKAPQVVNLSCVPPDEVLIEWTYDTRPDLYFILRHRPGNVSSFTLLRLNASLDERNHQEYALKNQVLDGWYEIGLMSVENEKNQAWGGRRESEWSETRMVFCNGGASAAESVDMSKPTFPSLLVPALLVSGTTVLLLCLLLGLFFWRKFYSGSYYYLDNPSLGLGSQGAGGWEGDDSSRAAVEIQLFPNHVAELHRDGDIGFSKEYEAITGVEEDFSSLHSSHPDNKLKNRYLNILAYDHTRVRLECNGTPKKSNDYVNGNYIDGFEQQKAYIGTQGPLPSTFEAFWQLVWENQVAIIVMITNLTERGRKKCDQYWPSAESAETYGLVQVRLVKEQTMATYVVRTFSLKYLKVIGFKSKKRQSCDERLVWQFHYTVWPDHGTPSHPLPVLSFVRKSAAANPPDAGPIIVHCSAGVGRTGTYIVLDAMLRQIAKRRDLNIFGFLRHIRRQRNFLVQTEEQYIFCHDVLLEAIQSGDTNVSLSRLPRYLKSLQDRTYVQETGEVISMFQRQYELVTGTDPKKHFFLVADKKCNSSKNRPGALKPTDNSRVLLIPKPGVDGSDYINASFLSGFFKIREFILTQHPIEATLHNFWQMLCDHNVSTVVLLSLVDDNEFEAFWPEPDADMDLSGLVIKHISGSDRVGIATRSFAIIQDDDDELHVEVIQSSAWPRHSSTPTDLFELIQYVQESVAESSSTGPIVVVDRFGGTEGATFCTLTTICNQLDSEQHLDIYLNAKLYNDQRPGIWPTFEDYAFLYESIDALTKGRRNSDPQRLNGPLPPSPMAPLCRAPPMIVPVAPKTTEVERVSDSPEPVTVVFDPEPGESEVEEREPISKIEGVNGTGEELTPINPQTTNTSSSYGEDLEDDGNESNSELISHAETVEIEQEELATLSLVNGKEALDGPEASVD